MKSRIHQAGGSVLLLTEGTRRQALRSGASHGMTMHGDPSTNAGLPLTLEKCQPKEATEEIVGLIIACHDSEMAIATMRPTQAEEMLVGRTKKEVEAGTRHLEKTDKQVITLGGSPGKITSLAGLEPASSGEEMMI